MKNKKYYLNECIKKLAPLELKNSIEYKNYVLKNKKSNFPSQPKNYFSKNEYWPGWMVYLSAQKIQFYLFEKAKKILKPFLIRSAKEFSLKIKLFSNQMPKAPASVYKKNNEWEGWDIF